MGYETQCVVCQFKRTLRSATPPICEDCAGGCAIPWRNSVLYNNHTKFKVPIAVSHELYIFNYREQTLIDSLRAPQYLQRLGATNEAVTDVLTRLQAFPYRPSVTNSTAVPISYLYEDSEILRLIVLTTPVGEGEDIAWQLALDHKFHTTVVQGYIVVGWRKEPHRVWLTDPYSTETLRTAYGDWLAAITQSKAVVPDPPPPCDTVLKQWLAQIQKAEG